MPVAGFTEKCTQFVLADIEVTLVNYAGPTHLIVRWEATSLGQGVHLIPNANLTPAPH